MFSVLGKKACVHIHGVFPYIYIPYEGSELPDRLKYQIATSLDKSINVSLGQANASTQHVFKIILVSGM
jgi:DNA polymerase zeta